ncbi:hypothetical protein CPLU01_10586 [Colletotrichum plurivorum]|uniref:Transcription regulator n=1 Tax=Colletotrichum plurivorum TaxID=2175906 RepID=A0A8H6K554_9PEZI|nr:hypothetical protein CPLU01_10586 [Colletotrichum plurivorum]
MPLTRDLLASDQASYVRATQSPFLRAASAGRCSKPVLGRWLANDRLYIHAYIRGTGLLLSALDLPDLVTTTEKPSSEERLLQWLVDALVNVRREEKFFIETAARFDIDVNLPTTSAGIVSQDEKLEGLRRFEHLFSSVARTEEKLGWLEGAVLLYATEKCYLDAWTGARDALEPTKDGSSDEDGGALRTEFIPNWSSAKFREFVDCLGEIIDDAVEAQGEEALPGLKERALKVWREVVLAEEHFWPSME